MALGSLPIKAAAGLRVLVAERNEMFRIGLDAMLRSLACIDHVEACGDLFHARSYLKSRVPHVVILSAFGLGDAARLALDARRRGAKTLLFMHEPRRDVLSQAAGMPVDGFLLATELTTHNLQDALHRLQRGELPMPSALTRTLLAQCSREEVEHGGRPVLLTPREQQTLSLLADGFSNKQIARRLGISEHGAKRHVANVLAKLNCPNRTLAVSYAHKQGLLLAGVAPTQAS